MESHGKAHTPTTQTAAALYMSTIAIEQDTAIVQTPQVQGGRVRKAAIIIETPQLQDMAYHDTVAHNTSFSPSPHSEPGISLFQPINPHRHVDRPPTIQRPVAEYATHSPSSSTSRGSGGAPRPADLPNTSQMSAPSPFHKSSVAQPMSLSDPRSRRHAALLLGKHCVARQVQPKFLENDAAPQLEQHPAINWPRTDSRHVGNGPAPPPEPAHLLPEEDYHPADMTASGASRKRQLDKESDEESRSSQSPSVRNKRPKVC